MNRMKTENIEELFQNYFVPRDIYCSHIEPLVVCSSRFSSLLMYFVGER